MLFALLVLHAAFGIVALVAERRLGRRAFALGAELIRLRQHDAERLVTVEGLRGAFPRPGVWYGETPLEQYGMMTIRLIHLDRTEPDLIEFEPVVAAVIDDVIAAAPGAPW